MKAVFNVVLHRIASSPYTGWDRIHRYPQQRSLVMALTAGEPLLLVADHHAWSTNGYDYLQVLCKVHICSTLTIALCYCECYCAFVYNIHVLAMTLCIKVLMGASWKAVSKIHRNMFSSFQPTFHVFILLTADSHVHCYVLGCMIWFLSW